MFLKTEHIKKECLEMQAKYFKYSTLIAMILLTVGLPLTLIIKFDFKKKINQKIVFAPITVAWVVYILTFIIIRLKIIGFYK